MNLQPLLASLVLCCVSYTSIALESGKFAPEFVLVNFANNQEISLKQHRGKVIYLDFWASWCVPCLQSFPTIKRLKEKYGDKGFEVISVNLDEDLKAATQFLAKHATNYPVVKGYHSIIAKDYAVDAMPTAFLIDGTGYIRLVHKGFTAKHEAFLDAVVDKLVSELN